MKLFRGLSLKKALIPNLHPDVGVKCPACGGSFHLAGKVSAGGCTCPSDAVDTALMIGSAPGGIFVPGVQNVRDAVKFVGQIGRVEEKKLW